MSADQKELFERFILSLSSSSSSSSSAALPLPRSTLLGATTHFLSTLPFSSSRRLVGTLVSLAAAWDPPQHATETRDAVRLGVIGAFNRIAREEAEGQRWYSAPIRAWRASEGDKWVQGIMDEIKQASGGREDRKADLLVALLGGILAVNGGRKSREGDDKKIGGVSSGMLRELQEEIILALAPRLEKSEGAGFELLAEVVEGIDTALLSLLDLPRITAYYRWTMFRSLDALQTLNVQATALPPPASATFRVEPHMRSARAFAHCVQAMYTASSRGGFLREAGQCAMLDAIEGFTARIHDSSYSKQSGAQGNRTESARREALYAYIVILSTYIDALLAHPPPIGPESRARSMDERITTEALLGLSYFSPVIHSSDAVGIEGYEKVLYGLLDVLTALGGTVAVSRLFQLRPAERSGVAERGKGKAHSGEKEGESGEEAESASDAWWMATLESVCREADAGTINGMRAIMSRRIREPSHQASFLAAHSLKIALIGAASETIARARRLDEGRSAVPGADALVQECREYCDLLIEVGSLMRKPSPPPNQAERQQFSAEAVTADQITSAYPAIIADVARIDPPSVMPTLQPLASLRKPSQPSSPAGGLSQSGFDLEPINTAGLVSLDIQIAASPHVPLLDLVPHLNSLADRVDSFAVDAEREKRRRGLFDAIVKDFPDAARVMGIEWWDAWNARTGPQGHLRARL